MPVDSWGAVERLDADDIGATTHHPEVPMLALLLTTLIVTDNSKAELKKMEGEWTLTAMDFAGKSCTKDQIKRRLKIEGDQVTYFTGETKVFTAKVTHFEPSARPGKIDLTRDWDDQTILGVYELEGYTLTLCTSSRVERPTEFTAGPDSPDQLKVYKRTKPWPPLEGRSARPRLPLQRTRPAGLHH
jgi:uncharacterized protein (TIGR03067 family)